MGSCVNPIKHYYLPTHKASRIGSVCPNFVINFDQPQFDDFFHFFIVESHLEKLMTRT